MQIRCDQADHQNQQILEFYLESICQNQRLYNLFFSPHHGQHLNKLTSQKLIFEWIQEKILMVQNFEKEVQECKIIIDNLINLLLPFITFNMQQYQELGLSKIDQLINDLCQMEDCEENLFKQLRQLIKQIKFIIKEIQNKIKNQTNLQQNDNLQIPQCIIDQQLVQQNFPCIQSPKIKPFTFDLMNNYSIKQNENCSAIAFNKDCLIVIAGCSKDIKVFQNLQGRLNQIQLLSEHTQEILTLNFMKNTNNFVSGSLDSSIIIWQSIENNQWKCQQKLNGHKSSIFCLLLNDKDDLIITGSQDKTIKFWIKQDQWLYQQTINDHTNYVYSLCLNEQQNKLISCSYDNQILVIEQQNFDKKWNVVQRINVDQYGDRLCFMNDDLFIFQPYIKEQMHVYEMDSNTKQYRKTKEIPVKCGSNRCDCLFPQQYLKQKCLLVNKNGKNVNIMRKKENGDLIIEQSIEFNSFCIYGQLSDNAEYLITWDYGSKKIQIRRCREL